MQKTNRDITKKTWPKRKAFFFAISIAINITFGGYWLMTDQQTSSKPSADGQLSGVSLSHLNDIAADAYDRNTKNLSRLEENVRQLKSELAERNLFHENQLVSISTQQEEETFDENESQAQEYASLMRHGLKELGWDEQDSEDLASIIWEDADILNDEIDDKQSLINNRIKEYFGEEEYFRLQREADPLYRMLVDNTSNELSSEEIDSYYKNLSGRVLSDADDIDIEEVNIEDVRERLIAVMSDEDLRQLIPIAMESRE